MDSRLRGNDGSWTESLILQEAQAYMLFILVQVNLQVQGR